MTFRVSCWKGGRGGGEEAKGAGALSRFNLRGWM